MDQSNISSSGVNRLQRKCAKEVTGTLEGQWLYENDCSVDEKRKYAVITNLGATFFWLGGSTNLKTICDKSFGQTLQYLS